MRTPTAKFGACLLGAFDRKRRQVKLTLRELLRLAILVAACATSSQQSSAADWTSLRGADERAVRELLRSGARPEEWDKEGNPALMVAALHATPNAVAALLDAGAEANATNVFGASALIYAVADPRKVELLLAHGADPNHASALGNTALIAAAGLPESGRSAAMLIAAGAKLQLTNSVGVDALGRAASMGNLEVVKLLLRHRANPNCLPEFHAVGKIKQGATPLHYAAFRGDIRMIRALLAAGADINATETFAGSALNNALYANHPQAAALLVKSGINLSIPSPRGEVPPMVWAGYSDVGDTTVARVLLEKGLSPQTDNEIGETALTWARKRGDNALVRFLTALGATDPTGLKEKEIPTNTVAEAGSRDRAKSIRASVQASLDLLQVSSSGFLDSTVTKRAGCVSCHHQTMPALAFRAAKDRGFILDEPRLKEQLDAQIASWSKRRANAYELDEPQPDAPINASIGLLGLAALEYKPNALTDAMVWYLATTQMRDGTWRSDDIRPPIEDGQIPATALTLRALQLYPIHGREAELNLRVARAAAWLARVDPKTPNHLNWQLLGLTWSKSGRSVAKRAAQRILGAQRPDGGWAQLPGLESDAWATGQALFALKEAAMLTPGDTAYQRGVAFLLRTQFEDGSWFVRSRSWPFQPYFHSKFPHGKDQWISAAGTTWAALALLNTIEVPDPVRVALARRLPVRILSGKLRESFVQIKTTQPEAAN